MNYFIDLSSSLSADYEKLYESGRYTDISIHVGKEPNSKIFLAHAVVLCTRSKFLESNLTEASEATQKAAITFENVSPDVFEILLRYIYTGRMSYDSCKNVGWISLLDGTSTFELVDLSAALETYLIDEESEWIQQNILAIHKHAASSTVSFNKLLAYCDRIMISHPDIILKSNDLATLPKETLIALVKNDELCMAEDDIWMSVIQWAIKQVPELELGTDSDDWSSNDTNTIKDIVADFIPHIRFFNISPKKVILYEDLLPKKLRRDILNYHTDKDYKPKTLLSPPRAGQSYILPKVGQGCDIDSVIIDNKQAQWLLSKIVESTKRLQKDQKASTEQDDVYKLTLLYRQSRNGNIVTVFRELCNYKGPTITIGKVSGTEEILGGYNPVSWSNNKNCYAYVSSNESFIFALDKSTDKNIISFVDDSSQAIFDFIFYFPTFGGGHDLYFGNGTNYKPYAKKAAYQFPVRSSSEYFEWADWEVFLVSNKQ